MTASYAKIPRQGPKSRTDEEFSRGDEVALSTRNFGDLESHLPITLCRRWMRPFRIQNKISVAAYQLELPPGWRTHPTFYISDIRFFHRSNRFLREDLSLHPVLREENLEYEVEAAICHKGAGCHRGDLVMWKGFPLSVITWDPVMSFIHTQEILQNYFSSIDDNLQTRATQSKKVNGVARRWTSFARQNTSRMGDCTIHHDVRTTRD